MLLVADGVDVGILVALLEGWIRSIPDVDLTPSGPIAQSSDGPGSHLVQGSYERRSLQRKRRRVWRCFSRIRKVFPHRSYITGCHGEDDPVC